MLSNKLLCTVVSVFITVTLLLKSLVYAEPISTIHDEGNPFATLDDILLNVFLDQENIDNNESIDVSIQSREEATNFIKNKDLIYLKRRQSLKENQNHDDRIAPTGSPCRDSFFKPINAIVLDAGHGGSDYGSIRHGIVEKNLTLILVKKIHALLSKSTPELKIYVTRNKDQFISLKDRVSKTAKWSLSDTILFVSLHGNSAHNVRAHGLEIYTLSHKASDTHALATERLENSGFTIKDIKKTDVIFSVLSDLVRDSTQKQSLWLARYIYDSTISSCKTMGRGLRRARFFVLNYNVVPSILIEVGFLSNAKEAKKLKSEEYQNKLAEGITRGLLYYISDYNKTEGFTK